MSNIAYLKVKYCIGYTYTKNIFIVYLTFKLHYGSFILCGNATSSESIRDALLGCSQGHCLNPDKISLQTGFSLLPLRFCPST